MSTTDGKLIPMQDDELVYAFLYSRVSSDDQAKEGLSLGEQDAANRTYSAGKPTFTIAGEYRDVQSGTKAQRADYQRMLHDIRQAKIRRRRAAVIVKFQDRLGRDMPEAARAYEELAKLGVDIHVSFSGGVPGELEYYMRALIAQEESRNIGRRVRENFSHLERLGWHKPGSTAWGYTLRPATVEERADGSPKNVVDVDETAAPYVREAWARLAAGESMRQVAIWVQGLPHEVLGGRNLGYNAIRKMLRAPVYVSRHGSYDDDDPDAVLARPVGRWPQLVDDEAWRRVTSQRALARKMPRQASGDYPLTGLIRCSRCGSRMSGRLSTYGGQKAPRREYICHAGLVLGAVNAERRCLFTCHADVIEQPILRAVTGMLTAAGAPETRRMVVRELERQQRAASGADAVAQQIAALEAARKKTMARMHTLTMMRADGELDAESYAASSRKLRDEVDKIDAQLKAARGRSTAPAPLPLEALLSSCGVWLSAVVGGDAGALRETLGVLLETVSPVRVARGAYEADPSWTPLGRAVLEAAVLGLGRTARTESEQGLLADLVSIDHLARAKCSILTKSRAAEPLARPA